MRTVTKYNSTIDISIEEYLDKLVNKIFKLLPLKEENNSTLDKYHYSLMLELIGFCNIFTEFQERIEIVSLLASLESLLLISSIEDYKRKVFECINIAKKIK